MQQLPISDEGLDNLHVKRWRLSDGWDAVKDRPDGEVHRLLLPFWETFENAFVSMYSGPSNPYHTKTDQLLIWLYETEEDDDVPPEATDWLSMVGSYVAIKDLLAVSFAIDFTREAGNPTAPKTEVAELRLQAKPYVGGATKAHASAGKKLAKRCIAFLEEMTCYDEADCVVAVPPSDPGKEYSLPRIIAAAISEAREIPDFSEFVSTIAKRPSIKNAAVQEKLATIRGTIAVEAGVFEGKKVLLIDDLYQSGTSINYCAQLLLGAGAHNVLGLACEKTCRNDDNV